MDRRGGDHTVSERTDAAEWWVTFAHDFASMQFGPIHGVTRAAARPQSDASEIRGPANAFDVAVQSIHAHTAALECDLNRALATRVIDNARFFDVPVPADMAALAAEGEGREED